MHQFSGPRHRHQLHAKLHPWRLIVLAFFVLLAAGVQQAHAIQASPNPIVVKQPDGTTVTLNIRGDEWFNWYEDETGYTVLFNSAEEEYVYAQLGDNGELEASSLLVGRASRLVNGLATFSPP